MAPSKKILVVDDEKGIRLLLSKALESEGFQVSLAKDGQECIDQLMVNRFDLVITDIRMPRLDGIETLKWMKQEGRKEKIIIITGTESDLDLSRADMPPVLEQLNKPFRVDSLLATVAAAVSGADKRARRRRRRPRQAAKL